MDALARARSLRQQGRHDEALTAFAEAVAQAQADGNPLLAAQVRIGEIDSLGMLGRYDEATALAESLLPQLPPRDAARALGNLGSVQLRRDQYQEALTCYDRAAHLHDDPRLLVGLAVNAGIALTYLGREPEAEARYQTARQLYQALGSPFDTAVVETNLGFLHFTAGRYAAALALQTAALVVFEHAETPHEAARCAIDLGETYRALNLFPEALQYYQKALAIFDTLPLDYDRARAELGQAACLAQGGGHAEAEAALGRAEALFIAQNNPLQQAQVRLLRALLYQSRGQDEPVRTEALAAQAGFLAANLPGWAAEAQLLLGQDLETVARVARETGRVWLESRAERALGRATADRTVALQHLRRSVAALEALRTQLAPEDLHVAFLTDKEAVYEELARLLLEGSPTESDVEEALAVTEHLRSRLLLERILAAAEALPTTPALEQLRAALSRAYHETLPMSPAEPQRHGRIQADLSSLEQAYAQALRQSTLLHQLPGATLQGTLPSLAALQAALLPEETLLVYGRFGEHLGVFQVERERLRAWPQLAPYAALEHAARRFRYHLQKMADAPLLRPILAKELKAELDMVLERLYDLLFRPLAPQLTTERLIVVPTGALHGVPLAALRDGNHSLLDRHELVLAPSAAVWHTLTQRPMRPSSSGALVVGVAGAGTEQVAAEVRAITGSLTKATVLEGEAARMVAVQQACGQKAVLHFATHALFRGDNPLFSGLQLADGWLLARDLYGMTLDADLVTLSACQTAVAQLAPGDEPFGLVRGFLAAGARQVVASLWPAEDAATAQLMEEFYRGLAAGQAPVTALREAQKALKAHWEHPYYWSAFCLIGSSH